jgi:hypothetical protein
VPFAQETRHRVDLPLVGGGPRGQVDRGRGRASARDRRLLGQLGFHLVQAPPRGTGLRAGLPHLVLGPPPFDFHAGCDRRQRGRHDPGRESEGHFVEDDREHPEHAAEDAEADAQPGEVADGVALVARSGRAASGLVHEAVVPTRSASSDTMSPRRKSFGV